MTDAVVIEPLNIQARRKAEQAIENVHLAYFEKDGIRDTAIRLDAQLQSAAKHVFGLAQYAAQKHPTDRDAALTLYLDMCLHAETTYKKHHDVDNLREALPTWATYKSNVLRGIRAGVDPLEYKTEKAFRSKTMELVSRSRDTTTTGEARAGPPKLLQEAEVEEFVDSTVMPEALKQLVAQVVYAAEVVKSSAIEQAEEILREAWQRLGALTDKRKVKP